MTIDNEIRNQIPPSGTEIQDDYDWEDELEERKTLDLRKIIAFELDNELYGVDIAEVAEIMLIPPIMPLPHVPDFILGLINLRGDILPVVDLRVRFMLTQAPLDSDSRIIVMKEDTLQVGVVVDQMWRLLRLTPEAFQPPPSGVAQIDPEYFKEVSDVDDRMLIVLDMHKILKETARKD